MFELFVDSDGYEFTVVSLDNKQWQFEAANQEVRLLYFTPTFIANTITIMQCVCRLSQCTLYSNIDWRGAIFIS